MHLRSPTTTMSDYIFNFDQPTPDAVPGCKWSAGIRFVGLYTKGAQSSQRGAIVPNLRPRHIAILLFRWGYTIVHELCASSFPSLFCSRNSLAWIPRAYGMRILMLQSLYKGYCICICKFAISTWVYMRATHSKWLTPNFHMNVMLFAYWRALSGLAANMIFHSHTTIDDGCLLAIPKIFVIIGTT